MVVIGEPSETEKDTPEAPRSEAGAELAAELAYEREITARLGDLESYEEEARTRGLTLSGYMSGGYTAGGERLYASRRAFRERLANAGIRTASSRHTGATSFAQAYYTEEEGLEVLSTEQYLDRHKFYLSLGEPASEISPEIARAQQDFLETLIIAAVNQGIDISLKQEAQGYDQPDIYTTQPDKLRELMVMLHNNGRYPEVMWNNVPRVFQGELGDGVPTEHIGIVQEPSARGIERVSHSARMGRLGTAFEQRMAEGGDRREAFIGACEEVGVRPDAPWKFNDATIADVRAKLLDPRT